MIRLVHWQCTACNDATTEFSLLFQLKMFLLSKENRMPEIYSRRIDNILLAVHNITEDISGKFKIMQKYVRDTIVHRTLHSRKETPLTFHFQLIKRKNINLMNE